MSDRLPRPRADLETFPAYRTQQVTADVRVNANEWPEPNPAGLYLSPAELDDILLNRYPSAAATADLRATLAARYGIKPEQLIFGNGSNDAKTTSLYFTAGPKMESEGIFGEFRVMTQTQSMGGMGSY